MLKLKKILRSNGYLKVFLDHCVCIFLDWLFCPPPHDTNVSQKIVINFSLPFTGFHSLQIQTQIMKLCPSAFPDVSLCFILQSGQYLSSFFPFKDQIPMLMRLHIVYSYPCWWCGASHFGANMPPFAHMYLGAHGNLAIDGKETGLFIHSQVFSPISIEPDIASLPTTLLLFLLVALIRILNFFFGKTSTEQKYLFHTPFFVLVSHPVTLFWLVHFLSKHI